MKKEIIIILLLLLILPLASAINFQMKETFNQEEILIAKLSGDFVNPPVQENIYFYRGHVRIGIDCLIDKIGDDYYLFAPLAGKAPNNYSIEIKEISYTKGSQTIEDDLIKNFTIKQGYANFIVDKGFVNTNDNFYIEVENLLDEDLEVNMNFSTLSGDKESITNYQEEIEHEFIFSPGKERIEFEINVKNPTILLFNLMSENTSYEIPISLYKDEQSESSKIYSFEIKPTAIDLIMNLTSSREKLIYIYNTGTGTLENVKLKLSDSLKPYVMISEESFGQILPNNNANLNMTILASGTDGKVITGQLYIETEQDITNILNIRVESKKGYVASPEELAPEIQTNQNCAEVGGKICNKNEECSENEFYALDGVCCPGKCKPKPVSSFFWKILGWGILIIIIALGIWFFFKKYKKVKKPVNLLKIAKRKT